MEPLGTPPGISANDALSLWVGRVAQAHALVEYGVDNVHRMLLRRAGHRANGKSIKGFDQLVTECISLLRRSGEDPEILAAGVSALRAAKQGGCMRNRIVHDMWLPNPLADKPEQSRWIAFRRSGDLQESYNSATSQDLSMVIDTHRTLVRTRTRVSGLFMALHETEPERRDRVHGPPADDFMARYVALMTDRFVLHPNGDFDVM